VRSALVARQTGQTVIGVIENMSGMAQPDGSVLDIFGSGGGKIVAERLSDADHGEVPLFGSVPLSPAFRVGGDNGEAVVLTQPEDPAASALLTIADRLLGLGRGLAGRSLGIRPR